MKCCRWKWRTRRRICLASANERPWIRTSFCGGIIIFGWIHQFSMKAALVYFIQFSVWMEFVLTLIILAIMTRTNQKERNENSVEHFRSVFYVVDFLSSVFSVLDGDREKERKKCALSWKQYDNYNLIWFSCRTSEASYSFQCNRCVCVIVSTSNGKEQLSFNEKLTRLGDDKWNDSCGLINVPLSVPRSEIIFTCNLRFPYFLCIVYVAA